MGTPAPTVSQVELDDELSLFDSRTGTALALNRTASDVWALADGRSSVQEVVATLARAYGVTAESIVDQVREVLDTLTRAGVLLPPAP